MLLARKKTVFYEKIYTSVKVKDVLLFAEEVIYFFRKRSLSSVRIQGIKLI